MGSRLVDYFVDALLGFGLVWFWAWTLNPNIDSGTVWLLGGIFSMLSADLEQLKRYARKK